MEQKEASARERPRRCGQSLGAVGRTTRSSYLWCAPLLDLGSAAFLRMRLSIWARVVSFMARTPFGADALQQAGDGWIVEFEPVVFGGHVDVAEADLLGGELELGPAVGAFALLDQALLV